MRYSRGSLAATLTAEKAFRVLPVPPLGVRYNILCVCLERKVCCLAVHMLPKSYSMYTHVLVSGNAPNPFTAM